jgi:dUTP pyrophosphatase
MMITIDIVNRCEDLPMPERATPHAAGLDLRAAVEAPLDLGPGQRVLVPTGLSVAIPPGYEGQVRPRSGLALEHGLALLNSPGTIDADYRGEIKVLLVNHGQAPVRIRRGERIAQLVLAPVVGCELRPVQSLPQSSRGEGGFGSSGR